MMHERETPRPGEYEVGYGKPPARTKFRKGASGNPGGRPHGITPGRLIALVLTEAYRKIRVKEGDRIKEVSALQAILRAQVTHAAKGNGPAQRAVIETVKGIEQEFAVQAAAEAKELNEHPVSDLDAARRIAFVLNKAARADVAADGTAPASDED